VNGRKNKASVIERRYDGFRAKRCLLKLNKRPKYHMVVDPLKVKDDLIRDLTEVLTSFFARLYGKRAAKDKAEKAIRATRDE
jgi:predicted site-specific integrase-resolvase